MLLGRSERIWQNSGMGFAVFFLGIFYRYFTSVVRVSLAGWLLHKSVKYAQSWKNYRRNNHEKLIREQDCILRR